MSLDQRENPEIVVVMITTGSEPEAEAVAAALLDQRLVACVNSLPGVRSAYWWQGKQESSAECLLVAKTRRALFPAVLDAVRQVHSYEVFEAVALPVVECNPDYARWVLEATAAAPTGPG
jgi:periplasmic divalent cation tolerance protein